MATTDRAITGGIIVRNSTIAITTGRVIMADITVDIMAVTTADTAADNQRGGFGPLNFLYSAANTAFATSAVPLLPPNSIGLMPFA